MSLPCPQDPADLPAPWSLGATASLRHCLLGCTGPRVFQEKGHSPGRNPGHRPPGAGSQEWDTEPPRDMVRDPRRGTPETTTMRKGPSYMPLRSTPSGVVSAGCALTRSSRSSAPAGIAALPAGTRHRKQTDPCGPYALPG